MKKNIVATFLALLICITVGYMYSQDSSPKVTYAGNQTDSPTPPRQGQKKPVIGVSILGTNEYPLTLQRFLQQEARDENISLFVYNAGNDYHKQNQSIQDIINKKVDVIILNPVDANGSVKGIQLASAAGIPVLAVNATVNSDKIVSYVGSNDIEAGEMEMKFMAEKLEGKGNVVILDGLTGQSSQVQRKEGITNLLNRYPQIHVLDEKSANWSGKDAYSIMKQWYQLYGNQINGIVCHNDEMALGAIRYLKEIGMNKKIPIVGVDAVPDALKAIDEGDLDATVFQDAQGQGKLAINLAYKILNKDDVAKAYFIPFKLVTKDNVSLFLREK